MLRIVYAHLIAQGLSKSGFSKRLITKTRPAPQPAPNILKHVRATIPPRELSQKFPIHFFPFVLLLLITMMTWCNRTFPIKNSIKSPFRSSKFPVLYCVQQCVHFCVLHMFSGWQRGASSVTIAHFYMAGELDCFTYLIAKLTILWVFQIMNTRMHRYVSFFIP